ncbi:MAG: metallophosphoesterase family protein [Chloroflexi bacterium]|nr:metallophosphoesterase family protein [Chloroflexota bacterium]MDA1271089.1 metallophosphoesterase family protein [Chloroflexota bacterium]
MRALILSDIHANLEALEAVLADAQARGGFDVVWSLGDTVGYGPDPGACIDRIREFELVAVAGNHDCAAVGLIDAADFNDAAKAAADWTTGQLNATQRDFLTGPADGLGSGPVHSGARQPARPDRRVPTG